MRPHPPRSNSSQSLTLVKTNNRENPRDFQNLSGWFYSVQEIEISLFDRTASKKRIYSLFYIVNNTDYGMLLVTDRNVICRIKRRGLYRMRQFYEAYKADAIVSPLVTQLSRTNHLIILSGAKSAEERRFYIELAIRERYSKRELDDKILIENMKRPLRTEDELWA